MKAYTIKYYLNGVYEEERMISLLASNKYEAYKKAVFEAIPERDGRTPFAAWVYSITYQNGNQHFFRGHCGNAYGD